MAWQWQKKPTRFKFLVSLSPTLLYESFRNTEQLVVSPSENTCVAVFFKKKPRSKIQYVMLQRKYMQEQPSHIYLVFLRTHWINCWLSILRIMGNIFVLECILLVLKQGITAFTNYTVIFQYWVRLKPALKAMSTAWSLFQIFGQKFLHFYAKSENPP